jgi:hypothetical protein
MKDAAGLLLVDGHVRIRGVAVERGAGKQPHIVTTREDLPALAVPYHISGRWRQTISNTAISSLRKTTPERTP